jgi:hypothetical protein
MTLLILYPQAAFTAALLALVIVVLSIRSPTPFIKCAMLICLLPVLPIIVVRCLAVWTIDLCDWLTVGRIWTIPSVAAARWFERRLVP